MMNSGLTTIIANHLDASIGEKPDILTDARIDLSLDYAEPTPLLTMDNAPLFTAGNISTIGGLAKSRKTFLIVLLAAKYLDDNHEGRILLLDTEMAKFHTIRTARRIHRLSGFDDHINNNRLQVYSLREYSTEKRVEALQQAIELHRPNIVFVDGIRDMVKDFNSPDESSNMVNMLMRLSSIHDCHICSILHENKMGGQLRGHLGTEIVNKSETVIGVKSEGSYSKVTPMYCRNLPFEEFCFMVNTEGLPELCTPEVESPKTDKLKELFASVITGTTSVSYKDLRIAVMEKTGTTERTSEKKIKDALGSNVIIKNEIGYYYLYKNDTTEDNELPF